MSSNKQNGGEFLYRVLEYSLGWTDRAQLPAVCRGWNSWLRADQPDSKYWRIMCDCLEREMWVSVAPNAFDGGTLRQAFESWHFRGQFLDREAKTADGEEKFSMKVAVRFRPDRKDARRINSNAKAVVIPLHQRLQMLKAATKDKKELKKAVRQIVNVAGTEETEIRLEKRHMETKVHNGARSTDGGGLVVEEAAEEAAEKKEHDARNIARVVDVDTREGKVVMLAPGVGLRGFDFDSVLNERIEEKDVFRTTGAEKLVSDFLNGYNTCLFVYGQTGSGKTYTMFGPSPTETEEGGSAAIDMKHFHTGIVYQATRAIMRKIRQREKFGCQSRVGVTYIEVYGNMVSDLLKNGELVSTNKAAAREFVLQGTAEHFVRDYEDIRDILIRGESQKRKASTAMNERSSRAHTLLILRLSQVDKKSGLKLESRLILADLGGAEQVKESRVSGERLKEATFINLGLLALKKCIEALQKRQSFVPFGDSQLTKLLSTALGGNSKTGVVVCASKETSNSGMTMQALRFGERCRLITNRAQQARGVAISVVESLNKQIKECEDEIKKKERWENREVVQHDVEEGKKVFVRSYLTGAEAERKLLEELLEKRNRLLGATLQ